MIEIPPRRGPAAALPLDLAEDVRAAQADGRAVVALESTIIAHGMPYPSNIETGHALEDRVRATGAVPATIAVLDGRIRVGLDPAQLDRLAQTSDIAKLSRRDLPFALARGQDGATTVAATMICAHLAGVRVFATGGLGGVHRGAETSFDVSADLEELAQTPVAVVCAGAKAILDLPKTLEYLETRGVPVIGYRTDMFPAFYTRSSGLGVELRCETPQEVAAVVDAQHALGYPGGTVVANPIAEADEVPAATVNAAIETALQNADAQAISGKAVTPFLLAEVVRLTGGLSLRANIALAKANASLAGMIAVALAALSSR